MPETSESVHIELTPDGLTLGIATIEAAREHYGLRPAGESSGPPIPMLQ